MRLHLYYNAATDELWYYFEGTPGSHRMVSSDGIHWSDKVKLSFEGGLAATSAGHVLVDGIPYRYGSTRT